MLGFICLHTRDAHSQKYERNSAKSFVYYKHGWRGNRHFVIKLLGELTWNFFIFFFTYMLTADRDMRDFNSSRQSQQNKHPHRGEADKSKQSLQLFWILSICNDVSTSEGWFEAHAFVLAIEAERSCQSAHKNKPTLRPKVQCRAVFSVTFISTQLQRVLLGAADRGAAG